jgi:hypothetical protein
VSDIATAQILTALKAFGEADLKQDPNSTLPLDIAVSGSRCAGSALTWQLRRIQSAAGEQFPGAVE